MSDLISIQEAIEKINERAREKFSLNAEYEYYLEALNDIMDDLVQLSTIDAVPVKHEVRINLNEDINVRLTDIGKDIYFHQFDDLNRIFGKVICKPSFPKENADGYTRFQLWHFMELYGEHIGVTKPNVIEPLEIIYKMDGERKDDDKCRSD